MKTVVQRSRRLGIILAVTFAVALICGTGPGILLVNRAGALSVWGIRLPYLYAWGLFWYLVEASCVIVACVTVWRESGEDGD